MSPDPLVEFEFSNEDPNVVYQCVGSLLDLGLANSGASVQQIEHVDVALGELIEAVSGSTAIVGARFANHRDQLRLTLRLDAPIELAPDDREIAGLGFDHLELDGSELVLGVARELDR